MKPRVTIIMGIYDCAKTLPDAIESILAQSFDMWKLVMCDDGSTDDTLSVAYSYRDKYPKKIIVIKNDENKGLNFTLNHCLKYADTDYVARMDGDDISLINRLEEEVSFLDNHKEYSIVSSPMIYFDDKGDFRIGKGNCEPKIKDLVKGTPFCHGPCMVKREAYLEVEGYSESKNRMRVEDWDLWVRMYEKGYRGYNLSQPLYKMRDDRDAYNRRKFIYRINEAKVSASVVKKFKLSPINYVWVLRPILVGLLPTPIYKFLHKRKGQIED